MQQPKSSVLEPIKTANIYETTHMSIMSFECTKLSASIFGVSKHVS